MNTRGAIIKALGSNRMSASEVSRAIGASDRSSVKRALDGLVEDGLADVTLMARVKMFRMVGPAPERTGTNPFEWRTYQHWEPS